MINKINKIFNIITIVTIILFITSILYRNNQNLISQQEEVNNHAKVVSESLWTFNTNAAESYLQIVCRVNKYKKIKLLLNSGKEFIAIDYVLESKTDRFFESNRLISIIPLKSKIYYNGTVIGELTVEWYNTAFYQYFYDFFIIFMLIVLLWFILKTQKHKLELENRVLEQTSELISEIEERRVIEDNLIQQKSLFEAIFKCIPDAIIYTNTQREVIGVNLAFHSIFGYETDDLTGKKTSYFYESPQEFERQGQLRFNLTGVESTLPYEVQYRKKDGTIFPGETLGTTIKNAGGEIIGYLAVIRDITERKMVEIQQKDFQSKLAQSQKMEAIGQLSGGIAHDFNNMLAVIMGAAQILELSDIKFDEKGLIGINMILEATSRAADLTTKLLAFGRKGKITSINIDIHSIIDDTIVLLERTIDKKIRIIATKNAENVTVLGDKTSLQNLLLNLGINASHAMENAGEIRIGTRNIILDTNYCKTSPFDLQVGEYIEINVQDNGVGIDPEFINKIFDPFFTTKAEGRGTGLGLSSVYGSILDHHGAINVYSEIGIGTAFHIYIPVTNKIFKKELIEEIEYTGSGCILLVDDEEFIRTIGKLLLEERGYSVILAINGSEALDIYKLKHSEIDLVITDMIMPIMNGSELYYQMKKIDNNCKVIITSGFIKDENLNELTKNGLLGFIQKPFKQNELNKMLSDIFGNRS